MLPPFFRSSLAAFPLFFLTLTAPTAAQQAAKTPGELEPLNRFPRMMQEWLVGQVRAAETRGNARREALKTPADAEAYVLSVRERIRECFGPEPERTPLNARVTRVEERDAYRLEMVVFESRPGFLVTGNLYVPKGREGKMPGVVGVCGHSANGKAAEAYQSFAQGLARLGYVCFIIDPPGQGERLQYLKGAKSRYGPGTSEHIQAGNQQTLVGEFLGSWFAWDGVRALDYLLTRPEVDAEKIGVTGNSGGGTQTTWLCGVEQRWAMAAPACFVTTFRRNAENELPADTEQCPPGVLARDLDHSDFLAALAPKPVVVIAQEKDYFDARGATEAYQRLQHLYTLLGRPDDVRLHIGGDYHGYSQVNREGMYRFFNHVTGVSDAQAEPKLVIEKDETLWVMPGGQVAGPETRTIFSFTQEKAERLAKERVQLQGEALAQAIRQVLKLPAEAEEGVPEYRILRSVGARQYPTKGYCTYAVETEPGVHALVTRLHDDTLTSRPPLGQKRAVLYLSHRSADAELRAEPLVRQLLDEEKGAAFYACDVRGIGESQPDICGVNQFLRPYGSDYFLSAHGLMLDRPYLGQRVQDVLRVIAWLADQGHEEIHLAGRGWGALAGTLAAVLEPRVAQVTLKNALASYHEVAVAEDYQWPYAMLLPNVLAHFDLPDCHAALETRHLRLLEPWGAADGMNP